VTILELALVPIKPLQIPCLSLLPSYHSMSDTHPHAESPSSPRSGTEDLPSAFLSLRKALKVCSFGLVLVAFFHMPRAFLAISRAEDVWDSELTNRELPSMFQMCVGLAENSMAFGSVFLLIMIACLVLTIRAKSTRFLYLNFGVFITMTALNSFLMFMSMEMLQMALQA